MLGKTAERLTPFTKVRIIDGQKSRLLIFLIWKKGNTVVFPDKKKIVRSNLDVVARYEAWSAPPLTMDSCRPQ